MTRGRRRRVDNIPEGETAIVGVNIRTLRQSMGWSQARLGELMGWQSASTVCAAEGRRGGRQRGFTAREIERLAAIFGVPPPDLTTRCVNCNGQPPAGFACLACGAALGGHALGGHYCRIEPFLDQVVPLRSTALVRPLPGSALKTPAR